MPKKERPLQLDMFTGEWVDNRTHRQKKQDAKREKPQQTLMFSQRDMAQFGVNPRPQFPLPPQAMLRFLDPNFRSPVEIEAENNPQTSGLQQTTFAEETED